jgi:ABC-type lipoprotein export system ATPase subunit
MKITLSNLRPIPLLETPGGIHPTSAIFGTECHFEKGKSYLIKARSGKGKSTLFHILYGLRKDYEGDAWVEETNYNSLKANDLSSIRQQKLSIVFQDLRLFPKLTTLDNLLLKAHLTGHTSKEELLKMVDHLEMTPFLQQTAETLSYGQRQRIAIIRALCQPFELLLLDEPFSHLDTKNIDLAVELIQQAVNQNKAGLLLSSLGEEYGLGFHTALVL